MMGEDELTGDEAVRVLRALKMAAHAALNHPTVKVSKTETQEWLVTCCGLGCPIHFSMLLREEPIGRFTNEWMFLNFFCALFEPETHYTFGSNGMEIETASGSGSVVMGGLHS